MQATAARSGLHLLRYRCRRPLAIVAAVQNSSTSTMSTYTAVKERVRQQLVQDAKDSPATHVHPVPKDIDLNTHPAGTAAANWARVHSFKAKAGEVLAVPDQSGSLGCVVLGLGEAKPAETIWAYAALPGKLPAGTYSLAADAPNLDQALLGWVLGKQWQIKA